MLVYAVTILLSAFLLFQIQPLIAKFILPWFGGSAAVWSASLLFFQLLLLAGYFYAHLLIRYLKPKQQLYMHTTLLAASLATLPIIPSASWKITGDADPTGRILLLLAATIGLPYTILSATSPLLQAWYLRTHHGVIPYRLFALSNFGSMLALLSYPTLVEPRLTLHHQAVIWSSAYAVFAAVCVFAGWKSREGIDLMQSRATNEDAPAPGVGAKLLWIGLSACASVLLLAVTSHLTQNVAPIPLLWIVPLSLYLLSFILCFESDKLYPRWLFLPLLVGALGLFTYGITWYENNLEIKKLIPALCGALFVCCMVCHGELSRRRPHPRYLTQFYLMVSAGGAVGGLFVALLSPRIFSDYTEMPVALVACAALVTCVLWYKIPGVPRPAWMRVAMVAATLAFAGYLGYSEVKKSRIYVRSARNFYGVLHVRDDAEGEYGFPAERVLVHGTIDHGTQLKRPGSERIVTSYFGEGSGINRAIRTLREQRGHLRLGILGLGAGVTATLANEGDTIHYYEINPLILDIATHEFGFYNACPAEKKVFMGDARLVLESLPPENLDFLAMDAFSSDAVPAHLLTREAYQVYLKHLKPDGVLAVHISNRYLNLAPVVSQAMADIGFHGRIIEDDATGADYYSGSTWTVLARDERFFDHKNFKASEISPLKPSPGFRAWTDDFSNLITILK
jgi:SAM-dependent methyltransferase